MRNFRKLGVVILFLFSLCAGTPVSAQRIPGPGGRAAALPGIAATDGIVCEIATNGNISGVSDTLNGTFTQANTNFFSSPIGFTYSIYFFPNSGHGLTDTITATVAFTNVENSMACQAYKNMATTSPLDTGTNNPFNATATGINPSSGNFQTRANGELLISTVVTDTSCSIPTAGTGTLIDSIFNECQFNQYFVQATASTTSQMTYIDATSELWGMVWASFKSNGSTIILDGACHASHDNGSGSSNTVSVTITC